MRELETSYKNDYARMETARTILNLADDMAAAMCNLNQHNYSTFIEAREMLKHKIDEICGQNRQ